MKPNLGLQWHVTNECDQRCQHCYIYQKNETPAHQLSVTINDCHAIVDGFISFCEGLERTPCFIITGGDPLLYEHIWYLLELIQSKGYQFLILGNPYHLNDNNAKRLKGLGCYSYQLSLDGLAQTHDSIRKPGSFNATLNAIELLNRYEIHSTILSTVSSLNYKELPELARLCMSYNVNRYSFSRYCPPPLDVNKYSLTPSHYRQFLSDMWSVFNENKDRKTTFFLKDHLWNAFLYEEGLLQDIYDECGVSDEGCSCGHRGLALSPEGNVYACRRFESQVGNIYEQSFKEIWFSDKMVNYRQINNYNGCKDCELQFHCRGCHAVSATTTGNFFDKDPQCWRC